MPRLPGESMVLTSVSNPRVKEVAGLRRRSRRDRLGLALIEGARELGCALDNGYSPATLFVCPALLEGAGGVGLVRRAAEAGAEIVECTEAVFAKISMREGTGGVLAVGPRKETRLSDLRLSPNALVVVAEGIEKPGNLGAILRSADAAAVEAVIVCDRLTDIYNPNVVRASIGTLFALPVVEAGGDEVREFLRAGGFEILAATPHARDLYTDVDMRGPTAILVGSERDGLSDFWMEAADKLARIPMLGQADSLNVSASVTVLLFEAVRQRHASGSTGRNGATGANA